MKGQKAQWFHQHEKTWSRHPFQHSYEENQKSLILLKSVIEQGKRLISHDPEYINWQRKVKCNWKHPKTGMKHVFVIKMKQKFPLHSEFFHTHIGKTSVFPVHASCLCPKLWPIYSNPTYHQIYLLMKKKKKHSMVSLVADHHMHPHGRSFLFLCQHKQAVFLPLVSEILLLLTHSLWSIKLLL